MGDPAGATVTLRSLLTGAVLGAMLVPCNVYSGLKIGWSFNMSIVAALLGLAFWNAAAWVSRRPLRPLSMQENAISQTAASASASIISAGLVAPIPALAILTGRTLSWVELSLWMATISTLGVVAGLWLRRQMLLVAALPFPSGVATAETVREIHSSGGESRRRTLALAMAATVSASIKVALAVTGKGVLMGPAWSLSRFQLATLNLRNLGFALDPSLLMIGFGAIVGWRTGWSMLLGATVAWGVLAPWSYRSEIFDLPTEAPLSVYQPAVELLMWPGVACMVTAALASFAVGIVRSAAGKRIEADDDPEATATQPVAIDRAELEAADRAVGPGVKPVVLLAVTAVVALAAVIVQMILFGIHPAMGLLAVVLTIVLAAVAARVSGETGIPPIGALGKVTQLTFGLIHPTSVATNLMTANVTGGAAGQCSDLLHDLKAGLLLRVPLRGQAIAQTVGVLTGSLAGTAAYLALVPDPAGMLLSREWPAPAVATWKAVAEVFRDGLEAAPSGAATAAAVAAVWAIVLVTAEAIVPPRVKAFVPSPVAFGLAFVIPAFNSISLAVGALAATLAQWWRPDWARRFVLPIAAGAVAGESLAGVAEAVARMIGGAL